VTTFADADHSFHVRKASGSTDDEVLRSLANTAADWMAATASAKH
jgi:hypothetical protein